MVLTYPSLGTADVRQSQTEFDGIDHTHLLGRRRRLDRRHDDSSPTEVEEESTVRGEVNGGGCALGKLSTITATVEEKVRQHSNLAVRATAANLDRMVRPWRFPALFGDSGRQSLLKRKSVPRYQTFVVNNLAASILRLSGHSIDHISPLSVRLSRGSPVSH